MVVRSVVWAVALLCAAAAAAQPRFGSFSVRGIVADTSGGPIPGASVSVEGRDAATTDERGVFEIGDLAPGRYDVRATIPGFREQTLQVSVPQPPGTTLNYVLRVGLLSEPHWVRPTQYEAVGRADIIAHVRLDGVSPAKLKCADLSVGAAIHNATVIDAWKGELPDHIEIVDDDTGTCVEDDGSFVTSANKSAYQAGAEYIVLLSRQGPRFGGLGPASYVFLVNGPVVKTDGFMGSLATMGLRDFEALLLKAAQ